MNGARTTHMWKGYLLTALAAAVLLAVSPGVVSAQKPAEIDISHGVSGIEIDAPRSVAEGDSQEITVSIRATGQKTVTQADRDAGSTLDIGDGEDVAVVITLAVTGEKYLLATPAEGDEVDFDQIGGSDGEVDYPGTGNTGEVSGTDDTAMGTLTITFDVKADTTKKLYEAAFFLDTRSDPDAEDENVRLTYNETTTTPANAIQNLPDALPVVNIGIDDEDTQTYVMALERGERPKEGEEFVVEIEADPEHDDVMAMVTLQVVDEDGKRNLNYTPVVVPVTLSKASESEATVTITAPANDGNRVTDTITLEAYVGAGRKSTPDVSLDIDVADVHALPSGDAVTAVAMDKARRGSKVTEVEEGGDPVYLTVTVDRGSGRDETTGEKLTINLTVKDAAQADDYDLTPSQVTLPAMRPNNEQSHNHGDHADGAEERRCRGRNPHIEPYGVG